MLVIAGFLSKLSYAIDQGLEMAATSLLLGFQVSRRRDRPVQRGGHLIRVETLTSTRRFLAYAVRTMRESGPVAAANFRLSGF
jgi:hypothetical protein